MYHLADVRGMSLWYDRFGVLGLSPQVVQDAVATAGSFLLKASELQQLVTLLVVSVLRIYEDVLNIDVLIMCNRKYPDNENPFIMFISILSIK